MPATTGANPTLTQDQVQRILIAPLQQSSTFLLLGCPTFTSNGEPIHLPRLDSYGTASYTTQGSAIGELNPTTSEVVLLASTVSSLKAISRVSNELVRQSVVNIESAFSLALVTNLSKTLDAALWNGAGTAGAPLGLFGFTGFTNAGSVAGTALASADLFNMDEKYQLAFSSASAARWGISPANFTRIRKMTDNYGARILQPSLAEGAPSTILGYPYTVSAHIPDTAIALFDKDQVAVGMDTNASITILDQTYADYDQVGIRVIARYDVKPLNVASVVKLTIS